MTDVLTPEQAEQALRTKIRDAGLNRCRILSDWKGAPCDCGLCLIDILTDRNTSDLVALRARCAALEAENGRWLREALVPALVVSFDEILTEMVRHFDRDTVPSPTQSVSQSDIGALIADDNLALVARLETGETAQATEPVVLCPEKALHGIRLRAAAGRAFGYQAAPQSPEKMVERKDAALSAILDYCAQAGVSGSVLRATAPVAAPQPPQPEET